MEKLILSFCFVFLGLIVFSQREDIQFSKDNNRIFYTGFDNQLTIEKGATVTSNGASISKKNDTLYIVKILRVPADGKIEFTVTKSGKSVSKKFTCKTFPYPELMMGSYSINGGSHSQSIIWKLASEGLKFGYSSKHMIYSKFFVSLECNISMIVKNVEIHSESTTTGKLSKKLIDLLKSTKSYKLKFTNIKYVSTVAEVKVSDIEITVD